MTTTNRLAERLLDDLIVKARGGCIRSLRSYLYAVLGRDDETWARDPDLWRMKEFLDRVCNAKTPDKDPTSGGAA